MGKKNLPPLHNIITIPYANSIRYGQYPMFSPICVYHDNIEEKIRTTHVLRFETLSEWTTSKWSMNKFSVGKVLAFNRILLYISKKPQKSKTEHKKMGKKLVEPTQQPNTIEFVCREIETRLSVQKPPKNNQRKLLNLLLPLAVHEFQFDLGVTLLRDVFAQSLKEKLSFVTIIIFKVVGRMETWKRGGEKKTGIKYDSVIWFSAVVLRNVAMTKSVFSTNVVIVTSVNVEVNRKRRITFFLPDQFIFWTWATFAH